MTRKPLFVSGSNSQNGQGLPLPPVGGSGDGENQRNFLKNAFPPGSPSSPGTAQEVIAQFTSGLRFIPDALLYGTPKDFIQPSYFAGDEAKAKKTVASLAGVLSTDGDDECIKVPICLALPFRQKLVDNLILDVVTDKEISGFESAKLLIITSDLAVAIKLNDATAPVTSTTFVFGNFAGGVRKLAISTTAATSIALYQFA